MTLDSFWLGPLTDLRQIEDPDSFDRTSTRVQSVFQGATGRVTANVTGVKRTWSLSWDRGLRELRLWLEAFQLGASGGKPLRFVDPYSPNLLDPRTASAGASFGTRPLFSTLGAGMSQTLVPITDLSTLPNPAPRLGTRVINTGASGECSIGWSGLCAPWLGGPVTLSAWIKSTAAGQLKLYSTSDDGESFFNGTVTSGSIAGDNAWHLVTVTGTPGPGAKGLYPAFQILGGATLTVGPLQLQTGSTATPWEPGVGGSVVIAGLSDGVQLFPYSDMELTLLEA
jgi:hypothetical protein